MTPTATNTYNKEQQQQRQATVSTDEDDDNPLLEQSNSPTHTISSNGHDTASHTLIHYQIILLFLFILQHSKDSSDDGKHTSCASSDIEVISSPSITSGLALSTTETFDKCRELRDARRPVVREVSISCLFSKFRPSKENFSGCRSFPHPFYQYEVSPPSNIH